MHFKGAFIIFLFRFVQKAALSAQTDSHLRAAVAKQIQTSQKLSESTVITQKLYVGGQLYKRKNRQFFRTH